MSYEIRRWNGSRQSHSLLRELARSEEEIKEKDKEIKELKDKDKDA